MCSRSSTDDNDSCAEDSRDIEAQQDRKEFNEYNISQSENITQTSTLGNHQDKIEKNAESSQACNVLRNSSSTATNYGIDAKSQVPRYRAIVSMLRYMLGTPKTSITFILFMTCYVIPISVPLESVREPMRRLSLLVDQEAARANTSYYERLSTELSKMNETASFQRLQLDRDRGYNEVLVRTVQEMEEAAWDHVISSRNLLKEVWSRSRRLHVRNDTCSSEDIANLTSRIYGAQIMTQTTQDVIVASIDHFVQSSRATLRHISVYSQERAMYDYNYFVGIKLVPALELVQNISTPELDFSTGELKLLANLEDLLSFILEPFKVARIQIEIYKSRFAELSLSITDMHLYALDLYTRLALGAEWAKDFLPAGTPLPSFLDIASVPLPGSFLPSELDPPSFTADLPNITAVQVEFGEKALQIVSEFLNELARKASNETQEAIHAAVEVLEDLLALDDYFPPEYKHLSNEDRTIEGENQALEEAGNSLMEKTNAIFTEFLGWIKYRHSEMEGFGFTTDDLGGDSVMENLDSSALLPWMDVELPSLAFPLLVAVLAFLFKFRVALDAAYQLVRFCRMQNRCENDAFPNLPNITFSDEEPQTSEQHESKYAYNARQCLSIIVGAISFWILMVILVVVSLLLVLTIYLPTVKNQCIDTLSGTFMARKFWGPNLVNNANRKGSADIRQIDRQVRTSRDQLCVSVYRNGKQYEHMLFRSHQATIDAQLALLAELENERQLISRCIDVGALDDSLQEFCCGLEGYFKYDYELKRYADVCDVGQNRSFCPMDSSAILPKPMGRLGTHLASLVFDEYGVKDWSLKQTNANYCEVLDNHGSIEIDGVEQQLILDLATEAFCRAEVWGLQALFGALVFCLLGMLLQVKCDCLFDGVKRCYWRQLTPDGSTFRCSTLLREDGSFSVGGTQMDRAERARCQVAKYEATGKIKLQIAGMLFVLEVVLLVTMKKSLEGLFGDF